MRLTEQTHLRASLLPSLPLLFAGQDSAGIRVKHILKELFQESLIYMAILGGAVATLTLQPPVLSPLQAASVTAALRGAQQDAAVH